IPNTIVLWSIASTYWLCPSVFGRMLLPRAVRMAWPSTSAGLRFRSVPSILAELVTSAGDSSWPLRTICSSSSTRRCAAATWVGSPARVISLPRTCTLTSGYWRSSVVSRRSCGPSRRTICTPSTLSRASAPSSGAAVESLEGKASFLEPAFAGGAQYMCMDVEHGLTRALARVEDQAVVAVAVFPGEAFGGRHQLGEELGVTGGKLRDVAVQLRLRNDEQVQRRLRGDVAERDQPLRVVD